MNSRDNPLFPKLPAELCREFEAITPSVDRDLTYWPCEALLKDGTLLACVYVVSDPPYLKYWGVYPWEDDAKLGVSIAQVESLSESSARLPASLANKLYTAGESGMGYTIFTVVFGDGSRQACISGNAVDFVRYPEGKTADDVVDIIPHEGRYAEKVPNPDYYWCLFSP